VLLLDAANRIARRLDDPANQEPAAEGALYE
jgi:hypothetical protein